MRLGLFMMPLHPPTRDYHAMLEEDFEAVLHADALGFDDVWIALSQGPAFDDYLSGSGRFAEQALRNLGYRLKERRGPVTG